MTTGEAKYTVQATSGSPYAMWAVVGLDGNQLYRFGTYETADVVALLLNRERARYARHPKINPERLAEIQGRLGAATPGPWRVSEHDASEVWADRDPSGWDAFFIATTDRHLGDPNLANAEFIAHAWQDMADLLAEFSDAEPVELLSGWEVRDAGGALKAKGEFQPDGRGQPRDNPQERAGLTGRGLPLNPADGPE